jgi:hypothetical protein
MTPPAQGVIPAARQRVDRESNSGEHVGDWNWIPALRVNAQAGMTGE